MVVAWGKTLSSWLRELMPSFMKTLRRWYWTVRGLMNKRTPISGFAGRSVFTASVRLGSRPAGRCAYLLA